MNLAPGTLVENKYRIVAPLGEGGMGTVYEAEQVPIGRIVALKVLNRRQARKKDSLKRFHREARAAAAVGHPNICEVYDFGRLGDRRPYFVMERLYGQTLADRIAAEGALPFDDVIVILANVLLGLGAAHKKRVLHRDIKPENVFLGRSSDGTQTVKILDFGVSKFVSVRGDVDEDQLTLTRTGIVMGTPYYMSLEQARGERMLDERVDVYACGVMFYEMLTGRRPFSANNYNALLMEIVSKEPMSVRRLRPALPLGFDDVLARAMAKLKENRFHSALEFRDAILGLRDRVRDRVRDKSVPPPSSQSHPPLKNTEAHPLPEPTDVGVRPWMDTLADEEVEATQVGADAPSDTILEREDTTQVRLDPSSRGQTER